MVSDWNFKKFRHLHDLSFHTKAECWQLLFFFFSHLCYYIDILPLNDQTDTLVVLYVMTVVIQVVAAIMEYIPLFLHLFFSLYYWLVPLRLITPYSFSCVSVLVLHINLKTVSTVNFVFTVGCSTCCFSNYAMHPVILSIFLCFVIVMACHFAFCCILFFALYASLKTVSIVDLVLCFTIFNVPTRLDRRVCSAQ